MGPTTAMMMILNFVRVQPAVGAPRYERWRVGVELLSFIAEG